MSRAKFIARLKSNAEIDREVRQRHIESVARFPIPGWEEDAIIITTPPMDKWAIPGTKPQFYFCAPELFDFFDDLMLRIEEDGFYSFDGTEEIAFEGSNPIHKLCTTQIRGLTA